MTPSLWLILAFNMCPRHFIVLRSKITNSNFSSCTKSIIDHIDALIGIMSLAFVACSCVVAYALYGDVGAAHRTHAITNIPAVNVR